MAPASACAPSSPSTAIPTPRRARSTRRALLRGAAWSLPTMAVASVAPAFADSTNRFALDFDGGAGSDGYYNTVTIRFGSADGTPITLSQDLTISFDVVGLNTAALDERSHRFAQPTYGGNGARVGSVTRGAYNATTRVTPYTWVIPAGTTVGDMAVARNRVETLFTFNDGSSGTSGAGRITNKFVFRSLVGTPGNPDAGSFSRPNPLPIDSSVVGDVNKGTISPNGIY